MSSLDSSSWWIRSFEEFHCHHCGYQKAYRSRPRNVFEKVLLPALMLKPVRCDRCYHRTYVLWPVVVQERTHSADKRPSAHSESTPGSGTRVA